MALRSGGRVMGCRVFILAALLFLSGCAHAVTRGELEREKVAGWGETREAWYYMGSKDGWHYLRSERFLGNRTYRIREGELPIAPVFPLARDRGAWLRMPWGESIPGDAEAEIRLVK
ncbi:MAG: hypothetical protein V1809_02060 [Planctomycetota bacterium]